MFDGNVSLVLVADCAALLSRDALERCRATALVSKRITFPWLFDAVGVRETVADSSQRAVSSMAGLEYGK